MQLLNFRALPSIIFLLAAAVSGIKFGKDSSHFGRLADVAETIKDDVLAIQNDVVEMLASASAFAMKEKQKIAHGVMEVVHEVENRKQKPATKEVDEVKKVPASKKQLYFRPVSITLYCVMTLTIQSLLIYTALALARNADELSGELKTSKITDVLSTASRSSVYSSMLSMLLVGCRMYILATTEGLGEPPSWMKACMVSATGGMLLQILLVLVLPLMTKQDASVTTKAFSELAGDACDVHPKIEPHDFHNGRVRKVAWLAQILTMISLYGGTAGVITGIVTFPAQTTQISPAVLCTILLSIMYFGVYMVLWCTRVHRDHVEEDASSSEEQKRIAAKCEACALSMSNVVKKAPMLAVIFLAARMRALQLDPPLGMPPRWAQLCFYTMTASLGLETLFAALVGATGQREEGYYGLHVFRAGRMAHTLQHTFAGLVYVGLIPVFLAIMLMKGSDGNAAPLSPTMKCVQYFSFLYFTVHIGQWVTFFVQDIFRKHYKIAQDTLLAAGVSVGFVPLLCILFVATRMRALQITQQEGSPQGWAQDCMSMCVFATYVQVLCCLLLPIFTNSATEVDGDGNATFDVRPMLGAYAVTAIKYVALLCLHGGVTAICVAVFTMTPETAHSSTQSAFDLQKLIKMGITTLVITLVALTLSSAKVIGMAIKLGIESADQTMLGTDIIVGRAALSVCEGYVNVGGLIVENPPPKAGKAWKSPCLMKVDKLLIKINMWRLVKSLGKEFQINAIILQGLHLTIEKSFGSNSNVGEIQAHIESLTGQPIGASQTSSADVALPAPEVIVNLVSIRDIGASAIMQGTPFTIQIGDLVFDDFQEKLEKKGSANVAGDIVVMIMQTVFKSVIANTPFVGAGLDSAKKAVIGAASTVAGGVEQKGRELFECVPVPSPRSNPRQKSSLQAESAHAAY
jgi:hypothetical protein